MVRTSILAFLAALSPQMTLAQDAAKWTGFYGGLSFGYTEADNTLPATREFLGGDESAGLFAGYDYAVTDQIVIGGEVALYDNEVYPDTDDGGSAILENLMGINARVGYAYGNALFYGGVGYMTSDLESIFVLAGPSDGYAISATLGIEAFVADNMTIRADITRGTLTDFELASDGYDVKTTVMRIGAAYRF